MPSRKRQTANVMVRRQALNRDQELLDEQAGKASAYIRGAVESYMGSHPDAGTADVRAFVVDLMQAALPNFTTLAETLSCEFMQELCDAYGWEDVTPTVHDTTDYEKVEKRIRYLAGELNGGDAEKFKDQVADVTSYFVRRSAQENMVRNCRDAEVRFARVPSGLETCSFCFMLASRGFVYWSEASARGEHGYHPHCTCTIVPGAKGRTKIDGYDPGVMYRNWRSCEETLGGERQLREDWKALPAEEKETYLVKHPAKYGGGYDESAARREYMRERVMDEVETRDWHWLYTGEAPKIDYSLNPIENYGHPRVLGVYEASNFEDTNGEWRDVFAHDSLSRAGFVVKTRPAQAYGPDGSIMDGVTNPDIFIGDQIWEIKSPPPSNGKAKPGNELNFISSQMRNANHNFDNPYNPVTKQPMGVHDLPRRVVLNLRYRITDVTSERFKGKLLSEMKSSHIHEVLVIDEGGSVRRFAITT